MEEVKVSEFKEEEEEDIEVQQQGDDEEIELEMLTEQCQELINRLSNCQPSNILDEPTQIEETINEEVKKQKSRLEKEYLQLCVQIERQQKELDNYKFKIKVSNKEAEYYSRQIKEKEQILSNLEKHQVQGGSAKKIQKTSRR